MTGKARVLLVDDDVFLISILRRKLMERYALAVASTAEDALEQVRAGGSFAVAVCDLGLPRMSGLELLDRLRDVSPDTVRIVLTGNSRQTVAVEAINRGGVFRYFNKPCPVDVLADAIEAGITQFRLRLAERALAENEARWRLALEAVGDAVWDWNPLTGATIYSKEWIEMMGQDMTQSTAGISLWWDRIHPEDRESAVAEFLNLASNGVDKARHEHRLIRPDGSNVWLLARGVILERGGDGLPTRVIGTVTDISARKDLEQALLRHATSDALTGLKNRRYFLECAAADVKRAIRSKTKLSALMIDIDFFKSINDTYGHAAGDQVLRGVADVITDKVRETDLVGRLGGEEFAILLYGTLIDEACTVAANLRLAIAAKPVHPDHGITVTVSIGVAELSSDGESIDHLLARADSALYQAKRQGRNQVRRYEEGSSGSGLRRGDQIKRNDHIQGDDIAVAPGSLTDAKVRPNDR